MNDLSDSVTYDDVVEACRTLGDTLPVTPLLRPPELEEALGVPLWLKAELLQVTGSFKARGALNWVRHADEDTLKRGLITVSAGNHAKALAWAASAVGAALMVVMPEGASQVKVQACRDLGAEVILHGEINETWSHADRLREEHGLTLVPPYDNPHVIAGQGTTGLEIVDQCPEVDVVLCPVGGGGLISGVAIAIKSRRPGVRIIGVEPARAETLGTAWREKGPKTLDKADTIAASLGANRAGEHTYALSRRWVDELVSVDEEAIREGFLAVLNRGKLVAEPGAAIAVAAVRSGAVSLDGASAPVAIVTGGNLDREKLLHLLRD